MGGDKTCQNRSEHPGLKGELNELPLTPWRVDAKRVWRGGMCLPRGAAWKESQPRPQPSSDSRQVINLMIDWNVELGAPPAAPTSGRGACWKMCVVSSSLEIGCPTSLGCAPRENLRNSSNSNGMCQGFHFNFLDSSIWVEIGRASWCGVRCRKGYPSMTLKHNFLTINTT